jgi:hypothetical protein
MREEEDLRDHTEKRESLVRLQERYVEAQKLVSSQEPYANLEWILGGRRNVTQDPLGLELGTIELVGLWLQDLAIEIDRRLPRPTSEGLDSAGTSHSRAHELVQGLRDATERFLVAFRHPPTAPTV